VSATLLRGVSLHKQYAAATALDEVSLDLSAGGLVALVGASGSGKSTLARCLAGLESPDSGTVEWQGEPIASLARDARRQFHRNVQLVMQDAAAALNPRWKGLDLIREPLDLLRQDLARADRELRARQWLERVELPADAAIRTPGEMSGGQRQRLLLARAMTLDPQILLLDEPLTGLDTPVQAAFLELLLRLRRERELGCLLVTHNIAVALSVADEIVVMHHGRMEDRCPARSFAATARHPHARSLLDAARERSDAISQMPYINPPAGAPL
jgi:peptide/nickel transport system ATP-binding protein